MRAPAMPARRPPPCGALPVAALLDQAEALARRWAIALILGRPLRAIGELPLEDLAIEAPALCARFLLALESDEELDTLLSPSSAGRLPAVAGARDGAELASALEALRGVLWDALLGELGGAAGEGRRALDAGDRLAFVCACALVASVDAARGERVAPPAGPRSGAQEVAAAGAGAAAGRSAVIVDEQAAASGGEAHEPGARGGPEGDRAAEPGTGAEPAREIAARDQRGDEGPAAWIGAVGRELARFERDGHPFAVMLLELPALARRPSEAGGERRAEAARVERALRAELGDAAPMPGWLESSSAEPSPALTRERPGRWWLIAPRLDRGGAELLAERLARAAVWSAGESALELVAGVAVCPEDGRDAAGLAAHADIELYAARRAR